MEPTREQRLTLDQLLNRVLDKGVLINADIVVSVAGIPLIGVNLKAAVASMETMLEYGMMQNLEETCRKRSREQTRVQRVPLVEGEAILLETLGSYYFAEGIYHAWRHGVLYLTNERLLLFHRVLGKVFLAVPLPSIRGLAIREGKKEELYLCLEAGQVVRIRGRECRALTRALEARLREMRCRLENEFEIPPLDGPAARITAEGERVIQHSRMWMRPEGTQCWQTGHLYLTTRKLCWWDAFRRKVAFEISLDKITTATIETHRRERVLDVIHENGQGRAVSCFSGRELAAWQNALTAVAQGSHEIESCPQCGHEDPGFEFLQEGCSECGWVSPKLEQAAV